MIHIMSTVWNWWIWIDLIFVSHHFRRFFFWQCPIFLSVGRFCTLISIVPIKRCLDFHQLNQLTWYRLSDIGKLFHCSIHCAEWRRIKIANKIWFCSENKHKYFYTSKDNWQYLFNPFGCGGQLLVIGAGASNQISLKSVKQNSANFVRWKLWIWQIATYYCPKIIIFFIETHNNNQPYRDDVFCPTTTTTKKTNK